MKIELRDNGVHIEGYVNVVDRDSRILPSPRGQFVEQVKPKTFQRALERQDNVDLLFNHIEDRHLGSTKEGNMQLYEDNIGLRAIVDTNDPEVVEKAKNNELTGWSFAFSAIKDSWKDGEDGMQRRYLEDITLPEVSILSVTPAYIATSIETRDNKPVITEQRNVIEKSNITDKTTKKNNKIKDDKEEKHEEKREKPIDYSLVDAELELYKLKQPKFRY
jgi:HK97 family phage prohead protease